MAAKPIPEGYRTVTPSGLVLAPVGKTVTARGGASCRPEVRFSDSGGVYRTPETGESASE
jgi:hypothetical protein